MAIENSFNKRSRFPKIKNIAQKMTLGAALLTPVIGSALEVTPQKPGVQKIKETKAQKIEREKDERITKIRAQIEIAQAERALRDAKHPTMPSRTPEVSDPDRSFGRPYKNEKDLSVSSEVEMDIFENGVKVGTKKVKKDSPEWIKLEKLRIKANEKIEKEKAKANRPIIVDDAGIGYGGSGYYGGVRRTGSDGEGNSNIKFGGGRYRR